MVDRDEPMWYGVDKWVAEFKGEGHHMRGWLVKETDQIEKWAIYVCGGVVKNKWLSLRILRS